MSQQDYSERCKLNKRDAGSVFANVMTAQPAIATAAIAVEQFAEKAYPEMPIGSAGVSAWIIQTLLFVACKLLAAFLRNRGESIYRYAAEMVWEKLLKPKPQTPAVKPKRRRVIKKRRR